MFDSMYLLVVDTQKWYEIRAQCIQDTFSLSYILLLVGPCCGMGIWFLYIVIMYDLCETVKSYQSTNIHNYTVS